MGGFGALDLARLHPGRFCTIGALDDASDFARHDVMGAARRGDPYGRAPILVDVGREDGFRFADEQLAHDLRADGADVTFLLQPGGHGGWRDRMDAYLRFYADALARC